MSITPKLGPLALYALIAAALVAWWRRAEWLRHMPTVLAVLWIAGGIGWLRTVVDLT
jgi:UDP-N-acetylmuramyl pentapeptide phosphotransferase/UDP-N-acetylglucosamine-1-phosphate transferase